MELLINSMGNGCEYRSLRSRGNIDTTQDPWVLSSPCVGIAGWERTVYDCIFLVHRGQVAEILGFG